MAFYSTCAGGSFQQNETKLESGGNVKETSQEVYSTSTINIVYVLFVHK